MYILADVARIRKGEQEEMGNFTEQGRLARVLLLGAELLDWSQKACQPPLPRIHFNVSAGFASIVSSRLRIAVFMWLSENSVIAVALLPASFEEAPQWKTLSPFVP